MERQCSECNTLSDCTTTCTYVDGTTIELCPTCLKQDGSFCLCCGQFCAGLESFDFIHPGYCDTCWDGVESNNWDDDEL